MDGTGEARGAVGLDASSPRPTRPQAEVGLARVSDPVRLGEVVGVEADPHGASIAPVGRDVAAPSDAEVDAT